MKHKFYRVNHFCKCLVKMKKILKLNNYGNNFKKIEINNMKDIISIGKYTLTFSFSSKNALNRFLKSEFYFIEKHKISDGFLWNSIRIHLGRILLCIHYSS